MPRRRSQQSLEPVPVGGKLRRRLYEHILFMAALNPTVQRQKPSNVGSYHADPAEHLIQRFLNSLALVCDTERGGNTITAVAVMESPVEYYFASNARTEDEIAQTRQFIEDLLGHLRAADDASLYEQQDLLSSVLKKVLCHCQEKVRHYASKLNENIDSCMAKCEDPASNLAGGVEILGKLQTIVLPVVKSNSDEEFAATCEALIQHLRTLKPNEDGPWRQLMVKASMQSRDSEHWSELKHFASRLRAYWIASLDLVGARAEHIDLFHGFEIQYLKSSPKYHRSFNGQVPNPHDMIGRMTSDPAEMAALRSKAEKLELTDLDLSLSSRIEIYCLSAGLPYVHAEVHLLDFLHRHGMATRFFNRFRYIGCSKPPCKLCHYYFKGHQSGVQVQPSHHNTYLRWSLPVAVEDSSEGEARRRIAQFIIEKLRNDIVRALDEMVTLGKKHDSVTEMTSSTVRMRNLSLASRDGGDEERGEKWDEGDEESDGEWNEEGNDEGYEERKDPNPYPATSAQRECITDAAESSDEDDGGGVSLVDEA